MSAEPIQNRQRPTRDWIPGVPHLLALCWLLYLPVGAVAQDSLDSRATNWAVTYIINYTGPPGDLAHVRDKMLRHFYSVDLDGGGVSEEDYKLRRQIGAARQRAESIMVMMYDDIDGDGAVSRAEVEEKMRPRAQSPIEVDGVTLTPSAEQVAIRLEKMVGNAMRHDGDGDDVVSIDEMLAAASARHPAGSALDQLPVIRRRPYDIPSFLDEDGDGVVALAEYEAIVQRAFGVIDSDGDGIASEEEQAAFRDRAVNAAREQSNRRRKQLEEERERRAAEKARKQIAACALPKAPAEARVMMIDTIKGYALSTAAIGGGDWPIEVIDVLIEAGDEPLFIVVRSTQAMIWRFSGSVDRVVGVVADSRQRAGDDLPRTGVVGIPADRVHFTAAQDCTPDLDAEDNSYRDQKTKDLLEEMLDHAIDEAVSAQGMKRIRLPSGVWKEQYGFPDLMELPKGTAGAFYWEEFARRHAGLIRIEPETVVSALPVTTHTVLPKQAGLAQLLDEGALKPHSEQESYLKYDLRKAREQEDYVPEVVVRPQVLVIQRKITIPAGLWNVRNISFILPPGVPEPDGVHQTTRIVREKDDSE